MTEELEQLLSNLMGIPVQVEHDSGLKANAVPV